MLLDQSPDRLYVAESGLVPAAGGSGLPNHHTAMTRAAGRAHAGDRPERAAGEVRVAAGRRRQAGQDLHLQARRLRHRRASTRSSTTSAAPVAPRLYLQLVRDGNAAARRVELLFHLHRPGDLHRRQQVPEDRLQATSRSAAEPTSPITRPSRRRLGRDGAALLRLGLADRQARHDAARASSSPARPTSTARKRRVLGRHAGAAGRARARARPRPSTPAVRRPAGREQARRAGAAASSWSRTTARSRSWPSRCSGC